MNKLAVLFPGVGYHTDKPLLYYAKKVACEKGYDIVEVAYQNLPEKIKGDAVKMKEAFNIAYGQVEEQLSKVDFKEYDKIIFIAKSIGTVIAGTYDLKNKINAEHITLTPVAKTFDVLRDQSAVVYHGLADSWCENDIVTLKCEEKNLVLIEVEDANHSMETGNSMKDIDFMGEYVRMLTEVL